MWGKIGQLSLLSCVAQAVSGAEMHVCMHAQNNVLLIFIDASRTNVPSVSSRYETSTALPIQPASQTERAPSVQPSLCRYAVVTHHVGQIGWGTVWVVRMTQARKKI